MNSAPAAAASPRLPGLRISGRFGRARRLGFCLALLALVLWAVQAHTPVNSEPALASTPSSARIRALDEAAALLAQQAAAKPVVPWSAAQPAVRSIAAAAADVAPPASPLAQPRSGGAPGASRQASAHAQIPDAIEGESDLPASAEALESVTIDARLRVLDGRRGPFRLLATRVGEGIARAQLQPRIGALPGADTAAWFERGDSPAPGWQLIDIAPDTVLLLTPQGDPMRVAREASRPAPRSMPAP